MCHQQPEAEQLADAARLGDGDHLGAQPQPLVEVLDVQQRGVAGDRARPRAPRGRRCGGPCSSARALSASVRSASPGEVQAVGEPRLQRASSERALLAAARPAPPRAARSPSRSTMPGRAVAAGEAERGRGQLLAAVGARASAAASRNVARASASPARSLDASPSASSSSHAGRRSARAPARAPVVRRRLLVGAARRRPARRRAARTSYRLAPRSRWRLSKKWCASSAGFGVRRAPRAPRAIRAVQPHAPRRRSCCS